jgi:2-polyprenyl-3-methyl-5-hydroxy-6-metoxy-1,4-benzoquinol methylase
MTTNNRQLTTDITETIACPLCGSMRHRRVFDGPDYFMRLPGTFYVSQCTVCKLLFQNPRPAHTMMDRYYPDQYGSYSSAQVGLRAQRGAAGWLARRAQNRRCHMIDHAVSAQDGQFRRLLDVGCASGIFLEAMHTYSGWQVEGVELNETAARATSDRLGVPVFAGPFEQARYPDATFDAITLWDVLEHLHDPQASLCELRRILKPNGALFVRVPNAASYVARLCGRYWSGYDLPRHMTLFTPRTLSRMLAEAGFNRLVARFSSGSYIAALHSLRFFLDDGRMKPDLAVRIHRTLLHPAMRAMAWAPFALADRMMGGSNLEVLVLSSRR